MKEHMRKLLQYSSRTASIILAFVLLVESALGSGSIVLADPVTEENTEYIQDESSQETEENNIQAETNESEEEPQILFEVESLREQNEKHYRLNDGTMMEAEYAMDVHYEDEYGNWTEIDNRFVYEPATESDAMEGYVTADGPVEFKFAPDTSREVVRATNGDYSVSFELITEDNVPDTEEGQVSEQPLEEMETEITESMISEEEELSVSELTETNGNLNMEEVAPVTSASSVPITFIKGEVLNEDAIPENTEALTAGTFSIDMTAGILSNNTDQASDTEEDIWTGDWETGSSKESLTEQASVDHAVTSVGLHI